ncbi:MAG: hypothetical protein ACXW2V_04135 [Candidatus Aminicenantales bacterium]
MMTRRLAFGAATFVLALAATAPAQELSLSVGAGGLFSSGDASRKIYGSSFAVTGDVWFKLKGPIGLAAGFGALGDNGLAVPLSGGSTEYPLKFRRRTIPLILFYQFDIGPIDLRAGAGAGFHSFDETWQTVDLDYSGHETGPRFLLSVSVPVLGRLSFYSSLTYDSIRKQTGYPYSYKVDLSGVQVIGGLAFRIF